MAATKIDRYRIRQLKDMGVKQLMSFGGLGVILALCLIFIFIFILVIPLFFPPKLTLSHKLQLDSDQISFHNLVEEQNQVAAQFTQQGIHFFKVKTGETITHFDIEHQSKVVSFAQDLSKNGIFAYGLENGGIIILKVSFEITYPDNKKLVSPVVTFPFGNKPIMVSQEKINNLSIQFSEDATYAIIITEQKTKLVAIKKESAGFLEEEDTSNTEFEKTVHEITGIEKPIQALIDPALNYLYILESAGALTLFDISNIENILFLDKKQLETDDKKVSSITFLIGGISVLVSYKDGLVEQWFPVKQGGYNLHLIRNFTRAKSNILDIQSEQRKKSFAYVTQNGYLFINHTTSQRQIVSKKLLDTPIQHVSVSPRGDLVLLQAGQVLYFYHLENEHPEVSWHSLWGKVWYENYDKPDYVWQSSSSSNDFEPKFSLVPLSFGTVKAAFYAMIFAAPLAILGAIFTAYFMTPSMRKVVKPTIEIMEALPTVILGFLAGLWLAPFIENQLFGIFLLLLLMPLLVIIASYFWDRIPRTYTSVFDGWQAALLIPFLVIGCLLILAIAPTIEGLLFSKGLQHWLLTTLKIPFDQRNSLVVGIAMGVAVIPTIFSIAEDAVFSVPKHLSLGSLALGATTWQTLSRVVILTASPGIFSALIIGFGRAIGETMIVLMATGNTPIIDFNIFQGMRTLSANIAVEMPESEVNSSHYRILFLAALVLFIFTFFFNTIADIIRHRLRKRYSSL